MAELLNNIFEISLAASFIIMVLFLITPLLAKRYSARSLCIIWLVVTLRLLVPVNLHLNQSVLNITVPIQTNTSIVAGGNPANDGYQQPTDMTTQPINSSNTISEDLSNLPPLIDIAAVLWAMGVMVFALGRFAGYYLLKRNIRRFSKPIDSIRVSETFNTLLNDMSIPSGSIAVRVFSKAHSPMMTGFIRPVILLPDAEYKDAAELELIIRHELVHYKRRDIWFKLLITCGNAVHWFNPFVYLMAREANRQIENACDQEIVKNSDLHLRKKYSESILAAMTRDQTKHIGLSTYFHGGKKTMKQRLRNIFDLKSKKRGTSIVFAALLIVLVSGTLVACQTNPGSGATATPPATDTPAATETISVTDPPPVSNSPTDEKSIMTVATTWAEAVKNRDGKAQYAVMTKALQEKMYDEFAGLNWVTGTSSPWVESYTVNVTGAGAEVVFAFATSTGSAGSYRQDLTFKEEAGALKIDSISELQEVISASPSPSQTASMSFNDLIGLIGMTKDALLKAIPEKSVPVDEGGLGFDKTGIRVWFDTETYTKVAQVLILSNTIDIDGLKLGDSYKDFKAKLGEPISDTNGDAHFKYGDVYLSVVRDTATDKTIAVYILAEDF